MAYEILSAEPTGRYELLPPSETAQRIDNDAISQGARTNASDSAAGRFLSLLGGGIRGAGSIGATLARPFESGEENDQRRARLDENMQGMGADPNSWLYKGGKLGAEIAGTAGVGNLIAKPVQALAGTRLASGVEPILDGVAKGLQTGGFRVGPLAGTGAGTATRLGTGAATGAASAGLVNPEDAGAGALIGGALPGAVKLAGATGNGVRKAFGGVSDEVRQLATRAQELGINIPADRLVNSRPLNAAASSLNYIPLSGRAATEDAMNSQLNRALSRTFGQDSSNVTLSLRKANQALGGEFERTLTQNGVAFDRQLLDDLATVYNKAEGELGAEALKPIAGKISEIVAKAETGMIDGRAAYNIKRDLDRLGAVNSPGAWHAIELKKTLMAALDRSLGPEKAAQFAKTRQQYGTMLDLEKLAKNGVEGEVSVARLANMKDIGNKELQELADIAAQFVKPRESAHGAAQRVTLGGLAAAGGMLNPAAIPTLLAGAAAGRGANTLLNSNMSRNFLLGANNPLLEPESLNLLTQGAFRTAPLLPGQ